MASQGEIYKEDIAVSMEFGVGSILDGKVTGITKFGAFVALQEGQQVKVKVIGIDQANRINLSIKKVNDPPARQGGGQGGRPPRQGAPRQGGPRQGGFTPRPSTPKEPTDFEDRLRQFMQASDSKLSELRYLEKKGSNRRGGGRR